MTIVWIPLKLAVLVTALMCVSFAPALVMPLPASAAPPDFDGDGVIAGDCLPLDPAGHPGAADRPDLAFEDLNCDGVDGDMSRAFFVSTAGNDVSGIGSPAFPFQTLQNAIGEAAKADPKRAVYVLTGNYVERVELAGGVSLYGGYLPNGARSATDATTIQAPSGAAEAAFANGTTGVELQLLTIQGADAISALASYAIRAVAGSALALTGVTATGGTARAGTPGSPGQPGGTGAPGERVGAGGTGGPGGNGGGGGAGGSNPFAEPATVPGGNGGAGLLGGPGSQKGTAASAASRPGARQG